MTHFSFLLVDRASQIIDHRPLPARDVWDALAEANRRLAALLAGGGDAAVDRRGRVDVVDGGGATVARIACAEAIAAMS